MLAVIIVYTVFSGVQSCANKEAADAAKSAALTSQGTLREMQAERQPWIGLEDNSVTIDEAPSWGWPPPHPATIQIGPIGPIAPHSTRNIPIMPLFVSASYSLKNFGTMPALREHDILKAVPDTGASVPPTRAIQQACSYGESLTGHPGPANPGAGSIILPGQEVPRKQSANLVLGTGKHDIGEVWFFVCTVYQDPRGRKIHHSEYWFRSKFKRPAYRLRLAGSPGITYIPLGGVTLWGAKEN